MTTEKKGTLILSSLLEDLGFITEHKLRVTGCSEYGVPEEPGTGRLFGQGVSQSGVLAL